MTQGPVQAGILDSLAVTLEVAAPTIAKGVIVRRPSIVSLAERFGFDECAVRRLRKLRAKHGDAPVRLRSPGRPRIVLLAPEDVKYALDHTPEPFAARTDEKHAALAHFEPRVALISHGPERTARRRLNEHALETANPVHGLSESFSRIVEDEIGRLLARARQNGRLGWDPFFACWYRIVRRVTLGDGARDDEHLTDMLETLRGRANWAFFRSRDEELRRQFHERLDMHLDRAEAGSLAGAIRSAEPEGREDASHQVAQWLFAFDPAGMATFRALALLVTHVEHRGRAREEAGKGGLKLPFLRAALLESLRLWPTTPAILRQTTREVKINGRSLPADATVLIHAPFFHRDEERMEFAHRFTPDLWLDGTAEEDFPLVPFSRGPGLCPARNLVPLVAALVLARLLGGAGFALRDAGRMPPGELPGTLDNYTLKFEVAALT